MHSSLTVLSTRNTMRACKHHKRVLARLNESRFGHSQATRHVNFLSTGVSTVAFKVSFSLRGYRNAMVIGAAVYGPTRLGTSLTRVSAIFGGNCSVNGLISVVGRNRRVKRVAVPRKVVNFYAIYSVGLGNVLLGRNMPVHSEFNKLLRLGSKGPTHFTRTVSCGNASLSPLIVFVHKNFADCHGTVRANGNLVNTDFERFPTDTCSAIGRVTSGTGGVKLNKLLSVNTPNTRLLNVPMGRNYYKTMIVNNLGPMSVVRRHNRRIVTATLSNFLPCRHLFRCARLAAEL